ncbi:hypothetical protein [Luteolibacter luteus]|uniref:Uncharacterized protein n=1 Tax=Luteolibacter luteus TaxID=2728835 RepID=A0A858RME6_9BACT|nr:hypothetical protein [Luteolibacter luteus]QJE97664.1 hypothetical protein HHL09_18390 [Luteolibacter luteus]
MMRLLMIFTLACSSLLHAQEPGASDLKVRFLAERAPAGLGDVVVATEKTKSAAFALPTNFVSPPVVAPARAFELRATAKDVVLAKVALPDAGKSFIVLLLPSPKGGYQPVVVRADDPAFKAGDVYFYNHADKPVLGFVGTAKFVLEPGKGQTLRPAGARPEKFYDVGFGVREKEGDRALSNTRWPVDNKQRSYIFFFNNATTKRVDYRAVDEFVEPEKPAP